MKQKSTYYFHIISFINKKINISLYIELKKYTYDYYIRIIIFKSKNTQNSLDI